MTDITQLFDWQVLLLICPTIVGIALFCFLLWSDNLHDNVKGKISKLTNKNL